MWPGIARSSLPSAVESLVPGECNKDVGKQCQPKADRDNRASLFQEISRRVLVLRLLTDPSGSIGGRHLCTRGSVDMFHVRLPALVRSSDALPQLPTETSSVALRIKSIPMCPTQYSVYITHIWPPRRAEQWQWQGYSLHGFLSEIAPAGAAGERVLTPRLTERMAVMGRKL
jgi:hypothetical protein